MRIKTEKLKQMCSNISTAVNPNDIDRDTRLLVLAQDDEGFKVQYTNGEYFVQTISKVDDNNIFAVSVDYEKFCKVVSCLTSDMVELIPSSDSITIQTSTGKFVMELTSYNKTLFCISDFETVNFVNKFDISGKNVDAIYRCNLREIEKSGAKSPVQKYVYFDNLGALSFTLGACVTNFDNTNSAPFLLHNRFVKLFKIFDTEHTVHFETCIKKVTSEMSNLLIKMYTDDTVIYFCVEDNTSLIVPKVIGKIRARSDEVYPYEATFSRNAILRVINLISIIRKTKFESFKMDFMPDKILWHNDSSFSEELPYEAVVSNMNSTVEFVCDIDDLKKTISSYDSDTVTVRFGSDDNVAIVMISDNIHNVIPKKRSN